MMRAACQMFTPALFNGAFAIGVGVAPRGAGTPMFVSALLLALALPCAFAATRSDANARPSPPSPA